MVRIAIVCLLLSGCAVLVLGCGGHGQDNSQGTTTVGQKENENG